MEDIDFEIQFCEGLIKKRPAFYEALSLLGDLYTQKGMIKEGLEIDLRLQKLYPNDPIVLYNLTCSYSLMNETKLALRTIKSAIKNGYDDLSHLEEDGDLENLLKDSCFQRYFSRLKEQKSGQCEE